MSKLQTYYHYKLVFQKDDQHTGGKWLIHGTNISRVIWNHIHNILDLPLLDLATFSI